MQLKIITTIEQESIVEIDLPYYFKHDLSFDSYCSVMYGKIEKDRTVCITEINYVKFEIEIKNKSAQLFGCYMTSEYNSDEIEFLAVKQRALSTLKEF